MKGSKVIHFRLMFQNAEVFPHPVLSKMSVYLVHGDGSLHSCRHCVHSSAHSQEVHRLVLLSDGVLGVDPRYLRVTFLDGLDNNTTQTRDPRFL